MKDEKAKAESKLKKTLDDHAADMRKFRQDQERKDAEHRDLVDKMRSDFESLLKNQQAEHDRENREREDRHTKEISDRI